MVYALTHPLLPDDAAREHIDNEQHRAFWDELVASSNRFDERADKLGVITPGGPTLYAHPVGAPPAGGAGLDPAGVGVGADYVDGPPVPGIATPGHKPTTEITPAVTTHHHIVEEIPRGGGVITARIVPVLANNIETSLLEYNEARTRALIKIVTSASVVMIGPARQGGNQQLTAGTISLGGNWWPQATGDPMLEIKSAHAVAAYGTSSTGLVFVGVWEETS